MTDDNIAELKDSFIVARKEFKKLFRNKPKLIFLFLTPLLIILFFGYGSGEPVKNSPILIVNNDHGNASSSLVKEIGTYTSRYGGKPMFSLTYTKDMSQSEAERKIDAGIYKGALIIPPDYSDNLAKNKPTSLTLLTDSSDTTTSGIIIKAIKHLSAKYGLVSLYVPNIYGSLEYYDFLIPGIIAFFVFIGSIEKVGSEFEGEKAENNLVRKSMIPLSNRSIILGKTIYQLILQSVVAVILILAAYLLLGFNMNGSWLLVGLLLVIIILGGIGIGLVISYVSKRLILGKKTSQEILKLHKTIIALSIVFFLIYAISLGIKTADILLPVALLFFAIIFREVVTGKIMPNKYEDKIFQDLQILVVMPSLFFTGVFFPLSSHPNWMRFIDYCMPLTYAIDAMRIIMIKGQGLSAISQDLIILTVFALITFTAGERLFRREA
jgi:ABC-2 type transport system permease protein